MKTRVRLFSQEDKETLDSMTMVGLVYGLQWRWKEAETLFEQVMETSKRVLRAKHPHTQSSMNNLAHTYVHVVRQDRLT
jgi:Tetratricopeptide repeat